MPVLRVGACHLHRDVSVVRSATPSIRNRSSRSRSEPSLRIPPSALRSGCPPCGCSPTARTASAATNWRARLASPRRPRGSCSRVSGSPSGRARREAERRSRSRRNLHWWQSPQHARGQAQATRHLASRSMIGKVAVMGLLAASRRREQGSRSGHQQSAQASTGADHRRARRTRIVHPTPMHCAPTTAWRHAATSTALSTMPKPTLTDSPPQRAGELLEPLETCLEGHLCEC